MKKILPFILGAIMILNITGCYSVFSGGTGGTIVDAESTSSPKQGIGNVDIYAYIDEKTRNSDFDGWTEGTMFSPKAEYYGHTSTASDGSFTLNKMVWKSYKPTFGKDADVEKIYLLFYHENYGLTKGDTVVISDSSTNTVYEELKKIRTTTNLNLSFIDVSTAGAATANVYVKVTVPQATETNTTAADRVFDGNITGSGTISISYPRENEPEVSIQYYQSADEITWKACANADNENEDYAFLEDDFAIKKTVKNDSYDISLYGKSVKLSCPNFSGQYTSDGSSTGSITDDGVVVSAKIKGAGSDYDIDCGEVTTSSQALGTSGSEKHGNFSGLASNVTWKDSSYTGKYATTSVKFYVNGVACGDSMEIRSNTSSYNVVLSN